MKLIKQKVNGKLALGIAGTPEEIQSKLDSLINWGAVQSARNAKHSHDGLHLGAPMSFQYVLLTEEQLRDYLINIVSLSFDIERLDMQSLPLLSYIRTQANAILAAIPEEIFLNIGIKENGERNKERDASAYAKKEIKELRAHPELV